MTSQHLKKMQLGRQRAVERQRDEWRDGISNYRSWVKREAAAYVRVIQARELHGQQSEEAKDALDGWHHVMTGMPPLSSLPNDSLWSELSGEHC